MINIMFHTVIVAKILKVVLDNFKDNNLKPQRQSLIFNKTKERNGVSLLKLGI